MQSNRQHILILIFLLLSIASFSQTDTLKAFYIDSTQHLYVSPTIPVNLYIGTSADTAGSLKLQGLNGKGNPLYWNGNGPQQMTHLNLYLGRKIRFDLFADGIPPQSKLDFGNSNQKELKNILYLAGGSIVEISATDENAGLQKTYYSVNGEPFKEYTEPLTFDNEGTYEIKVYSVDNLGNKEDEVIRKFIVDSTPPTSALKIDGDQFEDILSGRTLLSLSATDSFGVKEIMFSVDSSEFLSYSKSIQTARIKEGDHILEWYSTDLVGNKETIKQYKFFVDKTPPMVFEEIVGNSYMIGNKEYSSGRSQLKVAAVDNKSGVQGIFYSLNNGEYNKYEKPVLLSDLMGTMSVKSYAIDNVNNRSQSGASTESFTMPTIDITGPNLTYRLDGPKLILRDTLWIGPQTKITINATDKEAGVNRIMYTINKATEQEYAQPFSMDEGGYYQFKCTGFDNVDNINFLSFELGVDNTAPTIYYHYSVAPHGEILENGESIAVFPSDVKIFLAATDNLSGNIKLNYILDEGKQIIYRNPIENIKVGIHSLTIDATDSLGNSSKVVIKFKVE